MTAKEMLEALGFEQEVNALTKLIYIKNLPNNDQLHLVFCKVFKGYRLSTRYFDMSGIGSAPVDSDTHQAINKQCQELGWSE